MEGHTHLLGAIDHMIIGDNMTLIVINKTGTFTSLQRCFAFRQVGKGKPGMSGN
jgi:hypothetical protein